MKQNKPDKDTKRTIRPEIMSFAESMEQIMKVQDATKGDSWKRMYQSELYDMLRDEVIELRDSWIQSDIDNCKKELVDIANFCMMLKERLEDAQD